MMDNGTTYGNGHGSTASGYKEHLYPSDGELQVIKFARGTAEDLAKTYVEFLTKLKNEGSSGNKTGRGGQ